MVNEVNRAQIRHCGCAHGARLGRRVSFMEPSEEGPADGAHDLVGGDEPVTPPADTSEQAATVVEAAGAAPRGRSTGSAIRWVGIIAAVVLLVGLGFCGWVLFQGHQKDVAAAQALAAARSYVLTLTNIDSTSLDDGMGNILDGATGEFKDKYGKSTEHLRQVLLDSQAVTHGTVVEATVKSATKDKVVVLMFVDQSVSNRNSPTPQIDRSRIKMTMNKVAGRWLASKVELL